MTTPTGPGKYFIKIDPLTGVLRVWLYNFDIDGVTLKAPAHTNLLKDVLGPIVRDGGNLRLLGLASTTAGWEHDEMLGTQRAAAVHTFLTQKFGTKFIVSKEISFGKEMAIEFGQAGLPRGTADNVEAELWRGVVINAWNRSRPPPPDVSIQVPINFNTWADKADKVINGFSIALGIVDMVADVLEFTSLATSVAGVTAVTGPLGLGVSAFIAIIGMPLMWMEGDAIANGNGQIQGAADAIQDMADQYKDSKLGDAPPSKWPAIQVPEPHISDNPQPNASELAWRAGQRTGRSNAVKVILDLEEHPKPMLLPSGKHVRINGRVFLHGMSKAFGDNVGVKVVIEPANEELKKNGKSPFPTH